MTGRSASKIRGWLLLSCLAATLGLATHLPTAAQPPAIQPPAAPSAPALVQPAEGKPQPAQSTAAEASAAQETAAQTTAAQTTAAPAGATQAAAGEADAPVLTAEQREFFERQVRPLLVKRCFECHGGTKAAGGLSLATRAGWKKGGAGGPALVPGEPDQSLLIEAINHRGLEMPPVDRGGKLPAEEIALLTKWVAQGAPDPRDGSEALGGMTREEARAWWAFQPLASDSPPAEIDRLIEREWPARQLTPAPQADRRTLLRRAYYTLVGLPPTPAEMASFLADNSPDAFAKVVDRLLESPQYGVQWGRHWLDVVRYADTAGENTDRPLPHAWRYRNWVFDAFQRDLPFDQFVRLQLAGDLLNANQPGPVAAEGIVATGYLAVARRFGHDIDKDMFLTHEDVIDNLGRNFLGLSLGCARCHDHKYDPITAEDYYALYGIFDSTRFAFPGCEPKGQPRDLVPLLTEAEVEARMQQWRAYQQQVAAATERRKELAKQAFAQPAREATRVLRQGEVGEGATVEIAPETVTVRRGELLLLVVEPRGNHGADSTLAELRIAEVGGDQRQWGTADLLADFTRANPREARGATWSYVELTADGPAFLLEPGDNVEKQPALKKWSLGDTPSVFVNESDAEVKAWTTLPARSFFVHPGQNRPVAVAWTSPLDGMITVTGRVGDVHPAQLDGVAYRLEHVAWPATGPVLAEIGALAKPSPAPPQPVIPVAYAVVDRAGQNARLHERGDPEKLGAEIPRRWLSVFGGHPLPAGTGSGRRELADWVATHPLLARVLVNRVWEWHFGRGLVRTSNDFGSRGERPSHPELLEQLGAGFARDGFRLKPLHRRILLSQAWQRASAPPGASDPENRWLAHFNRRRLTAEELRDSLLSISGQLDLSAGEAHPFPPEATWGFSQHAPFTAQYETNRRSAFLMVQRQRRHPFLALFDGADPNASTAARQTTTVPTQALYFMNDPFFHQQAAGSGQRWLEVPEADRVNACFQQLFQRAATPEEQQRVGQFLADYPGEPAERWAALARVLLASNEFLHVD